MYRPLVLSHGFLQENNATGQVQRVFWEYLCEHGFSPTIICGRPSIKNQCLANLKCSIIPTKDSKLVQNLFGFFRRYICSDLDNIPDRYYFSWAKLSALSKAEKEVRTGQYDYIHSVIQPGCTHLVALEAKKKSGLPWIASFYEPWFNNPFRVIHSKYLLEKDRKLEKIIADNADAIIHTNDIIYNEWVQRYGDSIKQKMFVLPLVFNESKSLYDEVNKKKDNNKFIISHIGNFYLTRNSIDFLKSVRLMLDEHPYLLQKIELNFVGVVTDNDKKKISELGLSNITNLTGPLNENECQFYFENSDLFLAIDDKNSCKSFFPSKIMKYFYYGKPILGLTPRGSVLQTELQKSNNKSFANEDYQGIASYLYRLIIKDDSIAMNDTEYWKTFTMERVSSQYLRIVNKVLENNNVAF